MSGICNASPALERRMGLRKKKESKRENRKGAPENAIRFTKCRHLQGRAMRKAWTPMLDSFF